MLPGLWSPIHGVQGVAGWTFAINLAHADALGPCLREVLHRITLGAIELGLTDGFSNPQSSSDGWVRLRNVDWPVVRDLSIIDLQGSLEIPGALTTPGGPWGS